MEKSKSLAHSDESGFEFAKEMLADDETAAINFDRLQKDSRGYIIFEYLLCEEDQDKKHITPYTSHPNRYMHKNARKFIRLWEVAKQLKAKLYLVNYAKLGTAYDDEVLLMSVNDVAEMNVSTTNMQFTRTAFSVWFRKINADCLGKKDAYVETLYCECNSIYHKNKECPALKGCKKTKTCVVLKDISKHNDWNPCTLCIKTGNIS